MCQELLHDWGARARDSAGRCVRWATVQTDALQQHNLEACSAQQHRRQRTWLVGLSATAYVGWHTAVGQLLRALTSSAVISGVRPKAWGPVSGGYLPPRLKVATNCGDVSAASW